MVYKCWCLYARDTRCGLDKLALQNAWTMRDCGTGFGILGRLLGVIDRGLVEGMSRFRRIHGY